MTRGFLLLDTESVRNYYDTTPNGYCDFASSQFRGPDSNIGQRLKRVQNGFGHRKDNFKGPPEKRSGKFKIPKSGASFRAFS